MHVFENGIIVGGGWVRINSKIMALWVRLNKIDTIKKDYYRRFQYIYDIHFFFFMFHMFNGRRVYKIPHIWSVLV